MEHKSKQKMYRSRHNRMPVDIDGGAIGGREIKSTFDKLMMMTKRCDVIVLVFAAIILAVILPASVVECAKLETQIKLLLNDDDLLSEQQPQHATQPIADDDDVVDRGAGGGGSDNHEHYKLYRSELKRLSYETIHRIMRDEDESTYRRADVAPHNYRKRSYTPLKQHDIVRRSTLTVQAGQYLNLTKSNRTEFETYENATAITEINLSENRLTYVNLAAFPNLKVIDLSHNALNYLPISDNNTLVSLNLNGNRVSHGVAPTDYYLRQLHLSSNEIASLAALNLSLLNALETLDLSCNRIRTIETSFFPQRMRNLKHLNLAHNQLSTIYRETFYNLLSLNTLLLPHNNITDIDYETFLALPNLQYLDLSYNQLKGESIRALQGIPDLMGLSIAYNPNVGASMQEFVASWSLRELDASGTGLCQIPAALAQSVRTLKLTDNWLKIINCGDLDSYALLQYLDLSYSRIDDIEDDALGRLEMLELLFLDHNNLVKVPLSLPTSLEHLFLQYNRIMDIQEQAFIGLRNLQTLDLSGNQLLYLPALPLPKMLTLNLQSSGLKGVSQAIVHTLPRLRDLLLDDNPIKCSDLLGIAEWASPCRMPDRTNSGSGSGSGSASTGTTSSSSPIAASMADNRDIEQQIVGMQQQQQPQPHQQQQQQLQAVVGKIDLKRKFVQMHNFYENFKSSCSSSSSSNSHGDVTKNGNGDARVVAASMQPPACALDMDDESRVDVSAATVKNFNSPFATTTTTTPAAATTYSRSIAVQKYADAHKIVSAKVEVEAATTPPPSPSRPPTASALASAPTSMEQLSKVYQKKIAQTKLPSSVRHIKVVHATNDVDVDADVDVATSPATTMATTMRSVANVTPIIPTKSNADGSVRSIGALLQRQLNRNVGGVVNGLQKDETAEKLREFTTTTSASVSAATTTAPTMVTATATAMATDSPMADVMPATKQQITEMPTTQRATTIKALKTSPTLTTTSVQPATIILAAVAAASTETATTTTIDANQDQPETKQTSQTILNETSIVGNAIATTITPITTSNETNGTKTIVMTQAAPAAAATPTPSPTSAPTKPTATANTKKTAINFKVTEPKTLLHQLTAKSMKARQAKQTDMDMRMKMMPSTSSLRKSAVSERDKLANASAVIETAAATTEVLPLTTTTTTTATLTAIQDSGNKTIHMVQHTIPSAIKSASNYGQTSSLLSQITTTGSHQLPATPAAFSETENKFFESDTFTQRQYDTANVDGFGKRDDIRKYPFHSHVPIINAMSSSSTMATLPTTLHRHEPLQVHPKDRHLIGTPILMHRGQNMLVQTNQPTLLKAFPSSLLKATLPTTTKPPIATPEHKGNEHDSRTTTITTDTLATQRTASLDASQAEDFDAKWLLNSQHRRKAVGSAEEIKSGHVPPLPPANASNDKHTVTIPITTARTTPTPSSVIAEEQMPIWATSGKSTKLQKQHEDKRKLSLTMKKMTFTTTKHATAAPSLVAQMRHMHLNAARENEAVISSQSVQSRFFTELKSSPALNEPEHHKATAMMTSPSLHHNSKHSTVNSPVLGQPQHELLSFAEEQQHEQLLQALHDDEHAELTPKVRLDTYEEPRTSSSMAKHEHGGSKTAQWLDTRTGTKSGHPGLVILLSSSLFVVLLLGLMHVYRCDMPWRRHLPQPRPHQRHFNDDDAHSFLNYQSNIPPVQKWHHSTRAQPPYGSPLHNLHVRELQQTSAVDERISREQKYYSRALSYARTAATNYSGSDASSSRSHSSQSSATSIGGDEAFYIETAPDSGRTVDALNSDFLPMELLNVSARRHSSNVEGASAATPRTHATDTLTADQTTATTVIEEPNTNIAVNDSEAENNRKLSNAKMTQSTRKFGIW